MDNQDQPLYGQFSFDKYNRNPYSNNYKEPTQYQFKQNKYIREAIIYIEQHFPDHFGDIRPFLYPVTFHDAKQHFKHFLKHKLDTYGKYQDAVSKDILFGSHSLISSLLNVGLLSVQYVIDKTLKVFNQSKHKSTLIYSVEAFIRQIIGWRSYVRMIYHYHGEQIKKMNYFNHQQTLNRKWFHLDHESIGVPLVDFLIDKVKKYAYLNHIERLMFMGNFMLLNRLHPYEVYKWFMIVSIDSFDWVMIPNVYGMSQYALENMSMMTRPYISSSNYILKMSNFPDDPIESQTYKTSELWNSLFYKFIDDHQTKLSKNYFFKPLINKWKKRNTSEKKSILEISKTYLYSI
jgi:deoxyribodipyrimidine photolyase-related protein